MYDFIIIGAGVIGATIARELSRYELDVLILDKENDVTCGASKANSGIVHGGYDDKHGTMKSKMCRKGNRMFPKLNEELNFGYSEIGSLILAFSEEEIKKLEELYENGIKNGVDDLKILTKEEIFEMEPHVSKEVVASLYSPTSGVTSPYEMTIALVENALDNGVKLKLKSEVLDIEKNENSFTVVTKEEKLETKYVINCAGVYSDRVASFVGANNFTIKPRRGEYILLNKNQSYLANTVLFQCPTEKGKGILVTRTYHNNLMLGPNSQDIDDKGDVSTSLDALNYIVDTARKTVKDFDLRMTLTSYSGIRATPNTKDFIIEESTVKGFINVAGIESPGLTSSPAIGEYVIEIIKNMGVELKENKSFNPYRNPIIKKKDDKFDGKIDDTNPEKNIICRCEKVTEAEIIDAMNRKVPIDSTDAIKRRTRAGMGQCQGQFCGPRVTKIIAREAKIEEHEVTQRGKGSSLLPHRESRWFFRDTK